jgi:hypothetical protein
MGYRNGARTEIGILAAGLLAFVFGASALFVRMVSSQICRPLMIGVLCIPSCETNSRLVAVLLAPNSGARSGDSAQTSFAGMPQTAA